MRRIFLAFLSIGLLTAQTAAISPDDLLQRGREKYQAGRYADAVTDLTAAADAFLSPDIVQKYVTTGQPPPLTSFETAVVYLAMSYSKLGKDPQALEQIRRLAAAESIAPTYAKLSLGTDVADFEALAKRVAPTISIPSNTAIAALPPPPPPGPPPPAPAAPVVASAEQQLAAAQQEANARVAAAHTTAEQEAAQRIATEKAAIQKAADEKIAAERAAIQKEADRVIAEARAAAERESQEKIAAERVAMQKEIELRIAADRAAIERQTQEKIVTERESSVLTTLRRAEALAAAGQFDEANQTYVRAMSAPNASREVVAAAATGLYRTGDYADALRALQKLGTFLRGEEDLRFYKAVALYETGRYDEAKKELACALPYIQLTEDVSRYRTKIEQTNR